MKPALTVQMIKHPTLASTREAPVEAAAVILRSCGFAFAVALPLILAGCGQMGPLYQPLPQSPENQQEEQQKEPDQEPTPSGQGN